MSHNTADVLILNLTNHPAVADAVEMKWTDTGLTSNCTGAAAPRGTVDSTQAHHLFAWLPDTLQKPLKEPPPTPHMLLHTRVHTCISSLMSCETLLQKKRATVLHMVPPSPLGRDGC